jgi:hypothetical protein
VTPERREHILKVLARRTEASQGWIRLLTGELEEFGYDFFNGCKVVAEEKTITLNSSRAKGVGLPVGVYLFTHKVTAPLGGWEPRYTITSTSRFITTLTNATTSSNTIAVNQAALHHEREAMQEHHISKDALIEVVQENKDEYIRQFSHLKELYETKLAEAMHAHMEGEISQSQIMVTDGQGCRLSLPTSMEDTFDGHLRALNMDSREVIVLTHEEYLWMVESKDTNIANVNHMIKQLEDQA